MGAFMALPVAALISSFISNYRTPHEVVYESTYAGADDTGPAADDESASSQTRPRRYRDPPPGQR